jgi:hypothetical protein
MAGFFLTFSFFKFLNLKGFAKAYQSYDLIAKKFHFYGYIYPLIEFFLGLSYLLQIFPLMTNVINLLVMIISSAGVLVSLIKGKRIQRARLGTFFDLPMSTLTLWEDLLMVVMSSMMLFKIY